MFRIEAFIDDKQLAQALRALAGLARGQPSVTPVVNVHTKGKGAPKAKTNGSLLDMFEQYVRTREAGASLSPADIREWIKANGRQPSSMTYLATLAIKRRLLRRTGKSSMVRYVVTKPKPTTNSKKG